MQSITTVLRTARSHGRPLAVIAHTVKGKGVTFMENDLEWHYRPPNEIDLTRALSGIGLAGIQ